MGTTHYNFTKIFGTNNVDIKTDVNTPLQEIDTALYNAIQNEISNRNTAINNAKTQLNNNITNSEIALAKNRSVRGHHAVFVGDSWTFGTGADGHHATAQMDYDTYGGSIDSGSTRWTNVLCSRIGVTQHNYSIGATGFVKSTTFKTQLETAVNRLPANIIDDVRLVVIAGGLNDARDASISVTDITAAADSATTYALNNFPNAFIVVIPMMHPACNFEMRRYNVYKQICNVIARSNAFVVRNAWQWLYGNDAATGSDNLHPTQVGHTKIAAMVNQAIKQGETSISEWGGYVFQTGFSRYNDFGYVIFEGGMCHAQPGYINGTIPTGNNIVATIPNWACPSGNVYTGVYKGDDRVGTCGITPAGSVYINNTSGSSISGGVWVEGGSWLPFGKAQ